MIFDKISLLGEACENDVCMGDDIDKKLAEKDLAKQYENIDPIDPKLEEAIFSTKADPKNVNIITNEGNYYIDYADLYTYMEATDQDELHALNSIMEAYDEEAPDMSKDTLYVVLPCNEEFEAYSESAAVTSKVSFLAESGVNLLKRRSDDEALNEGVIKNVKEKLKARGVKKMVANYVNYADSNIEEEEGYIEALDKDESEKSNPKKIKRLYLNPALANIEVMDSAAMKAELKNYSAEERAKYNKLLSTFKKCATKAEKLLKKIESSNN